MWRAGQSLSRCLSASWESAWPVWRWCGAESSAAKDLLNSPSPLCLAHFGFVHSEVMRNLMPYRIRHHLFELRPRACGTFVWTLEDRYLIRHREPFEDRAVCEWPTLVEAKQAGPRWLLLDDDGNVFHVAAKPPWNPAQRVLDQEFEFGNRQHSRLS